MKKTTWRIVQRHYLTTNAHTISLKSA